MKTPRVSVLKSISPLLLASLGLVCILLVTALVIYRPKTTHHQTTQPEETAPSVDWSFVGGASDEAKLFLATVAEKYPRQNPELEAVYADIYVSRVWVTEDRTQMPLKGSVTSIEKPTTQKWTDLKAMLLANGFVSNKANNKDQRKVAVYSQVLQEGYEKGADKCLATLPPSDEFEYGAIRLYCGSYEPQSIVFQKEISPDIFMDGKHDGEDIVLYPDRVYGDFAKGSMIHADGHLMFWIAKKVSGKWQTITPDLHEAPYCSDVDGKGLPKQIYDGECVASDGSMRMPHH